MISNDMVASAGEATDKELPISKERSLTMELYCGIDLHSRNGVYFVTNEQNKTIYKNRLSNRLSEVLRTLEPLRDDLKVVAVESTYNWYWLVDGLIENGYPVSLVNPSAVKQYTGLKEANDWTDAALK